MIISAHPDDSEFGIAGTVSKWTREGKEIVYVICTNGNKGSSDPDMRPSRLAEIREREQLAAAKVLGIRETVFMREEDQSLEDTPEFRKSLVYLIRKYRPEIVASTDPYRRYMWHRDHRIAGQAVLDAVFPYARDYHAYPDLIQAGFMPHKVKEVWLWGAEQPNHCIDITDTFEQKIKALRCHQSQVGQMPPEWETHIKARYANFAKGKPYELAEAFYRLEVHW